MLASFAQVIFTSEITVRGQRVDREGTCMGFLWYIRLEVQIMEEEKLFQK